MTKYSGTSILRSPSGRGPDYQGDHIRNKTPILYCYGNNLGLSQGDNNGCITEVTIKQGLTVHLLEF